jgi:hypothetical protein
MLHKMTVIIEARFDRDRRDGVTGFPQRDTGRPDTIPIDIVDRCQAKECRRRLENVAPVGRKT